MCGLFGSATPKPVKHMQQVMIQLALYNEERGKASWGMTNGTKIWKDVGPIGRNLYQIPFQESGFNVAHTRAATVGDTKKANAHPFEFTALDGKAVIGVHNGTLTNWEELNKKYGVNLEVDSMHIFRHIALSLPLAEISGWGTIVFFKDNRLNFCRFNGGVLSVAQLPHKAGIVWSSEEYALEKALDGAGLKYKILNIQEKLLYYYDDGQLWNSKEELEINQKTRAIYPRYRRAFHDTLDSDYNDCFTKDKVLSDKVAKDKRIVRVAILREESTTLTPEQVELEKIMQDISTNQVLFDTVNYATPCTTCKELTTRRFLGKDATCLRCVAKLVKDGTVVVANAKRAESETQSFGFEHFGAC